MSDGMCNMCPSILTCASVTLSDSGQVVCVYVQCHIVLFIYVFVCIVCVLFFVYVCVS